MVVAIRLHNGILYEKENDDIEYKQDTCKISWSIVVLKEVAESLLEHIITLCVT